jgi:hypothetical protein
MIGRGGSWQGGHGQAHGDPFTRRLFRATDEFRKKARLLQKIKKTYQQM